jgi:hypothetical protein
MSVNDRKYSFFETPPHYIAALISEVNIFGYVFEPCVGDGAIADALRTLPSVRYVVTNDIDHKRSARNHEDARNIDTWADHDYKFDWAVTNPPFSDELVILENALATVPNVAFLARLSFLEPTKDREYLLGENPPQQIIVLPRYSFRLNDAGKRQTDNVTCCWLVWTADKQYKQTAIWGRGKSEAHAVLKGLV